MIELSKIMKRIEEEDTRSLRLTRQLRLMFPSKDSFIQSTKWEENEVILSVELRSSLLNAYPRFSDSIDIFLPSDLLALVPLVAIVAEKRIPQLKMCFIERSENTRIFIGLKSDSTDSLAIGIWRLLERWKSLSSILYITITRNYPDEIDWREFLAGESGFIIIGHDRTLSYAERKRALDSVRLACTSLLRSVLDDEGWTDSRVCRMISFLDSMNVQPDVPRMELNVPDIEIPGGVQNY